MMEEEEEDTHELPAGPADIKSRCHFLIRGAPPERHAKFGTSAKRPKWPRALWRSKVQIYDINDPSKCLCAPDSRADVILRFDSKFESGNLARVFLLGISSYHCILEYDPNDSGPCQWFYFKMTNTRKDVNYRFYISGFHKGKSLYCSGSKVFWYSTKDAMDGNVSWRRGGTRYAYQVTRRPKNKAKRASLQFQIKFPHDDDEVCLCYAIPYTYSDLTRSIGRWMSMAKPGWMKLEKLCDTVAGRECPLLTLTNPDAPDANKKCIFVTGRIHPGESNSSFMVHGLIDYLLSECVEANEILTKTVVKCVPMMNIDGVVAGFYRTSLTTSDLNRMWTSPDEALHPVVYATKNLVKEIATEREIAMYLDFHGHSRLHGTFAYGCPNDEIAALRHTEKTYPRVMAYLSDAFSWNHCVFSFPKDRQAAGRIVVRTEVDVVNSFTIESSFGGIIAGPRSGLLYDEVLWKELGSQCGIGIYHMLKEPESQLTEYVRKEVSSMLPEPDVDMGVTWMENVGPKNEASEMTEVKVPLTYQYNIFHSMRPRCFLPADEMSIDTSPAGTRPIWEQNQFFID